MSEQAVAGLDVDSFWERGFAVLPGVYSETEVASMREAALESKDYGGDLLANPRLRHVLLDGRLIQVARALLGTDDIVYLGDSSFTINGTQRGFHKDNTDRQDRKAPDWSSRYTQLRFGIYCQDHTQHTGGLNLRVGSHDICDTTTGENVYVKTAPGDLAVWSMRISHSGNGMLLKDPSAPFPLPEEQDSIPAEAVAPRDGDRIAIFAHLGADDAHAKRYGDYLKTRTYMVEAWRNRPWDEQTLEEARRAGLTVRNLPAEVMNDPGAGLEAKWKPFPYQATPASADRPAAGSSTLERYARGIVRRVRRTYRGLVTGRSGSQDK